MQRIWGKLVFNLTPFSPRITCRFVGDRLHYQHVANAAIDRRVRQALVGRIGRNKNAIADA